MHSPRFFIFLMHPRAPLVSLHQPTPTQVRPVETRPRDDDDNDDNDDDDIDDGDDDDIFYQM